MLNFPNRLSLFSFSRMYFPRLLFNFFIGKIIPSFFFPTKLFRQQRMHSQLFILTAFAAIFLTARSASVLPSSPPLFSAIATTETTPRGSNPPTNSLLPRATEQQVGIPFAKCSCRAGNMALHWDCFIYQILNWSPEQNVILRLYDELVKCGTHQWGLRRYYVPERDSGLGAFAFFQLQFAHMEKCWKRGIASALGTTGVVCSRTHTQPRPGWGFPWWDNYIGGILAYPQEPHDRRPD